MVGTAGTTATQRRSGRACRRWHRWAALLLATTLLAGCGVSLDTRLVLSGAGAGKRTMTLTVPDSLLNELPGGTTALETSIRGALPEGMAFDGIRATPQGTRLGFSISFSSIDQYRSRVANALKAGDVPVPDPVLSFEGASPPFLVGTRIDEQFSSTDLLRWLPRALVSDGVLDESQAAQLTAGGRTDLVLDGQEQSVGERISAGERRRLGFTRVSVETDGIGTGRYTRTLTLEMPRDSYDQAAQGFDRHVRSATPQGARVTRADDADSIRWVLVLPAADARRMAEMTDALLGATNTASYPIDRQSPTSSSFVVQEALDSADPLTQTTTITDTVACGIACAPGVQIARTVLVPASWGAAGERADSGRTRVTLPPDGPGAIRHRLAPSSLAIALDIDPAGRSTADAAIGLPTAAEKAPRAAIARWLTAGATGAEVAAPASGQKPIWHVRVSATTPQQLSARLRTLGFTTSSESAPAEDGQPQDPAPAPAPEAGPPVIVVDRRPDSPVQEVHVVSVDARAPRRWAAEASGLRTVWSIRAARPVAIDRLESSTPAGELRGGTVTVRAGVGDAVSVAARATRSRAIGVLAVTVLVLALIGGVAGAAIVAWRRARGVRGASAAPRA